MFSSPVLSCGKDAEPAVTVAPFKDKLKEGTRLGDAKHLHNICDVNVL